LACLLLVLRDFLGCFLSFLACLFPVLLSLLVPCLAWPACFLSC
jgi:hypothetical protein